MKFFTITLIFIMTTILFTLTNCGRRWSDKEINDFDCKCRKNDTFQLGIVYFNGFDNTEFDSIQIKEFKNNILIDSFKIFVEPAKNGMQKRSATIQRTMHTNYKYEFIINKEKPYELSNMEMIMWSEWTNDSENYGCEMGNYTLDGLTFKEQGNLNINKRN